VKDRGKIGLGKAYIFLLAFSFYMVFLVKNDIHLWIIIFFIVLLVASSIFLYRRSEGWILATIVPSPFLFITIFKMFQDMFGLEHYLTKAVGVLMVLSIPALGVLSFLHNLDKSMEEDR
jgi:hypothetical protein